MKRGREREKEKNGGKVIFKYSYQKKKKMKLTQAKGEKQSGAELLKNIYNIWLQVQITSTTERRCIDV